MKGFWHRFWSDVRRPGNVKNEGFVSEGRNFLRNNENFGVHLGGVLASKLGFLGFPRGQSR